MGLYDKFQNQDTTLHKYDGRTPGQPNHEGATAQSKLHAFGTDPGYSLDGAFDPDVRKYDASYDNGKAIILPRPSKLDLNGKTPKGYANPEGIQYSGRNLDLTN